MVSMKVLPGRPGCSLLNWTFANCSFRKVPDDVLPDWKRHSAASWNRKPGRFSVMRHVEGFSFDNAEFDTP